jgi:hypothetical protein
MSELLEKAVDALRQMPISEQDDIARAILCLVGHEDGVTIQLSADEHAAIERSKRAAADGDFASDDEVAEVWAKHGQ